MKKVYILLLCILLLSFLGCSNEKTETVSTNSIETDSQVQTKTETQTDSQAQTKTEAQTDSQAQTENDSVSEATEGAESQAIENNSVEFVAADTKTMVLPDSDNLTESASLLLASIGVTEINDIEWGNYSLTSEVYKVSLKFSTETGKTLILDCMYISYVSSPDWTMLFVRDFDTGNYYYVPDEQITYVDLYDYKTDTLISEKSEEIGD